MRISDWSSDVCSSDLRAPDKHDHLNLDTAAHSFALCDPRRFGTVDLAETAALESWPQFAVLGPEPLGDHFTADHLRGALMGRKQAIKRSEEHTSELQSLMRISYAVFCLQKKKTTTYRQQII